MKTIAYTALHYGADYLGYAIRSVIDYVDEYWVLYSANPSHGSLTVLTCPETREQLYAIALDAAQGKLRWVDGNWIQEGQHRDAIHKFVPDADVVLVLDADEIWGKGLIEYVSLVADLGQCNQYRMPIIHYWRSFKRCVLHDPAFPIRVIFPKLEPSINTFAVPDYVKPINHMGYAIKPGLMYYKWQIHGHKSEMSEERFSIWYNSVYMANRQFDCHPLGSEYWNPETVNPLDYMPEWMREHPYFGLEVIE